jgi:hypothetical protein
MLRRKPLPAQRTVPVKQVGFRARLFLILLAFALIPTIVLAAAWELTVVRALPLLGTAPAMERIAASGERAISAVRTGGGPPRRSHRGSGPCWTSMRARWTRGCCAAGRWSS